MKIIKVFALFGCKTYDARPCGDHNLENPCMRNGKYKNHYPKQYSRYITYGKDGYFYYYRKMDGIKVKVRNYMLDNRWVVLYNPYL
jgi:hypothetical protein